LIFRNATNATGRTLKSCYGAVPLRRSERKDLSALGAGLKIGDDNARHLLTRSGAREVITLTGETKF
jgi:hypothetical protein